jgi:16S rRNA (cytosine967-C5)-methyltransferase
VGWIIAFLGFIWVYKRRGKWMKSARAVKVKSGTSKKSVKSTKKAKSPSLAKKITSKIKALVKPNAKLKAVPKVKEVSPKEKAKLVKVEEGRKKAYANPFETILSLWKTKAESFEQGLEKFFTEFPPIEKDVAAAKKAVWEKVTSQMRKHPLSPDIEQHLAERFSKDRIHKVGTIFSMKPKSVLRLNTLKADLQGFGQSLIAEQLKIRKSTLSPWAFEVGKPEGIESHPAYQRGLFEFQDEASQIIALLVNARAGQRILVLNAGSGDTALAISAMMRNKGSIFVYDTDPKKLKLFRDKAEREGIDNFRVLTDSQISEVKGLDAVLIEAPSSSLGVIGYHPELKWKFHKEDLPRLQKVQAALLREGGRKLKLGGYMIYSTYTLTRSENEEQIDHFLRSSHNSFRLVPAVPYVKEFVLPYITNFYHFAWDEKTLSSFAEFDPYFTLSPDVHGTPGLFAAVIQRTRISS